MEYTIWTTVNCNLKCKYCYEGLDKPSFHMTFSIAEKIFEYIVNDYDTENQKELLINFHGGEPFLNFEIIKFFVSKIKKYYKGKCKYAFTATTNATILNDEIIKFIIQENIGITVSLDGTKDTHNRMRPYANGQGSFDKAMKNSLILLEEFTNLRVRMTYNPETVGELCKNVMFLLDKGFLVIAPGADLFDSLWDETSIITLKEQIQSIKAKMQYYPKACIGVCEKLNYCGKVCKGGINSKHFYFDGSIYPCMIAGGHDEFIIGNVFDGINKEKHKTILEYSRYENPACKGCDLDVFCEGARCKIVNKIGKDNYDIPMEITCELTNLIYSLNGVSIPKIEQGI